MSCCLRAPGLRVIPVGEPVRLAARCPAMAGCVPVAAALASQDLRLDRYTAGWETLFIFAYADLFSVLNGLGSVISRKMDTTCSGLHISLTEIGGYTKRKFLVQFFLKLKKYFFLAPKHRLVYFSHILEHLGRLPKKIRNDFIDFRGLSIRSPRARGVKIGNSLSYFRCKETSYREVHSKFNDV